MLNIIEEICSKINNNEYQQYIDDNYSLFDELLVLIISIIRILCSDNILGCYNFQLYESWYIIKELFEVLIKIKRNTSYSISIDLFEQLFSLLCCFTVIKYKYFDEFKINQRELIIEDEFIIDIKKLKASKRKEKVKRDNLLLYSEFCRYQCIMTEILEMMNKCIYLCESNVDDDIDMKYTTENVVIKFIFECFLEKIKIEYYLSLQFCTY